MFIGASVSLVYTKYDIFKRLIINMHKHCKYEKLIGYINELHDDNNF